MATKNASKAPATSAAPAPGASSPAGDALAETSPANAVEGQVGDSEDSEGAVLTSGEGQSSSTAGTEGAAMTLGNADAGAATGTVLDGTVSNSVFLDTPEKDRGQGDSYPAKPIEFPYQVCSVPIRHNGEYYSVGSTVHLTFADAARLGPLVIRTAGASDEN